MPTQPSTPAASLALPGAAHESRAQRYLQLLLLVIAAGAIYPMLYLRQVYQPTMLQFFRIDDVQLGYLYSSLGTIFLLSYLPSGWLDETQLRVSAYRELAESMVEKDLDQMEARWRDRFGRLPEPAENLITVGRIRLVAAGKGVASVELKGQRLMLQRGGDYIMLEGTRFPRLTSEKPNEKLHEALEMLRTL